MQPKEWELAYQLVKEVEERVAPKAVDLQKRIDATLTYMDGVTSPNVHTLAHIRRLLIEESSS